MYTFHGCVAVARYGGVEQDGGEVSGWGGGDGLGKGREPRAAASFWAKVVPREGGDDSYTVENATGVTFEVERKDFRQRVFVKQCHAGVTADKKHDRYRTMLLVCLLLICLLLSNAHSAL